MGHGRNSKGAAARKSAPYRPAAPQALAGLPGVWVKLTGEYINLDNVAFVEETDGESWLIVHMLKDRADRQKLPVRNEQPWRRKTRKLYLMGEDAKVLRKWLRSRCVLLILPKRRDPDQF